MILLWLLIIPALGGVIAVAVSGRSRLAPRVVALVAMAVELGLAAAAFADAGARATAGFFFSAGFDATGLGGSAMAGALSASDGAGWPSPVFTAAW